MSPFFWEGKRREPHWHKGLEHCPWGANAGRRTLQPQKSGLSRTSAEVLPLRAEV